MKRSTRAAVEERLVLPVVCALCAIPVAYALERLVQARFYPDPDPRLVLASGRIAMFWRLYAALPIALVVGVAVDGARARFGDRLVAILPQIVLVSALIAALQGALVP